MFSADIKPEMVKLCRVTKVKVFFLVLVYVSNFDLFEFSAAIFEKGLFFLVLYPLLSMYIVMVILFFSSSQVLHIIKNSTSKHILDFIHLFFLFFFIGNLVITL